MTGKMYNTFYKYFRNTSRVTFKALVMKVAISRKMQVCSWNTACQAYK